MQKLNRFAANKKSSTTYFLSVYLWLVRGRFIKFVNYKPRSANDNRLSCHCKLACLNNFKIFRLRAEEIFPDTTKERTEGSIEIALPLLELSFSEHFPGVQ